MCSYITSNIQNSFALFNQQDLKKFKDLYNLFVPKINISHEVINYMNRINFKKIKIA